MHVLHDVTGRSRLFIDPKSGRMVMERNGILRCDSGTDGLFIRRGNRVFRPQQVTIVRKSVLDARLFIDFGEDLCLELSIEAGDDAFDLTWEVPQDAAPQDAGFSFDLAESGSWYGLGELAHQRWPLDAPGNEISLDPFMTRDPFTILMCPLWLTSSGFGLLFPMHAHMAHHMNHRGDGRFHLEIRNVRQIRQVLFSASDVAACHRMVVDRLGRPVRVPPDRLFAEPVWTSWVEFKVDVDQEKILSFARAIRENGFPGSVIEIDDRWQRAYGDTDFDPVKFPDPSGMVETLHAMGFAVTLWTMPFINRDSAHFAEGNDRGFFVKRPPETFAESSAGHPPRTALLKWWQGEGAVVDFTNPEAAAWFRDNLLDLQQRHGVDGFKFDAGEAGFIPDTLRHDPTWATRYTDRYVEMAAAGFPLSEVRVGWLSQSCGALVRQYDKFTGWGLDNGLHAVVTQALTMGMIGHPFLLPDMIGGNQYGNRCDAELFLRWVEATALLPSMQFSITPWSLGPEVARISCLYARLHAFFADIILEAAHDYVRGGLPIVCSLNLAFPGDSNTHAIDDQFLLAGRVLAAPVVRPQCECRMVYLPTGTWFDPWTRAVLTGPASVEVPAPIHRLPFFLTARYAAQLEACGALPVLHALLASLSDSPT